MRSENSLFDSNLTVGMPQAAELESTNEITTHSNKRLTHIEAKFRVIPYTGRCIYFEPLRQSHSEQS